MIKTSCNAPLAKVAFLPQLLPSNPRKFEHRVWKEVNRVVYEASSPKIDSTELIKISVIFSDHLFEYNPLFYILLEGYHLIRRSSYEDIKSGSIL